ETSDFSAFPDVSVICGERRVSPIDGNALINPSLLVEVTSRSTEDYDRGEKLSHYQRLPSVCAVVFVSHRQQRVTVVERAERAWSAVSGGGPSARWVGDSGSRWYSPSSAWRWTSCTPASRSSRADRPRCGRPRAPMWRSLARRAGPARAYGAAQVAHGGRGAL